MKEVSLFAYIKTAPWLSKWGFDKPFCYHSTVISYWVGDIFSTHVSTFDWLAVFISIFYLALCCCNTCLILMQKGC
jgi:hypothetical protein